MEKKAKMEKMDKKKKKEEEEELQGQRQQNKRKRKMDMEKQAKMDKLLGNAEIASNIEHVHLKVDVLF